MVSLMLYLGVFGYTVITIYQMRKFDNRHVWTLGGRKIQSEIFWFIRNSFVWIPVLLVYSLRNLSVGNDTANYSEYFNIIKEYSINGIFNDFFEPGYSLLNIIVGKINGTVNVLFFLCGILMFAFLFIGLHKQQDTIKIEYGIYIYLMTLFSYSMNMVRQMMAMIIVLYGARFIKERNLKKYILTIVLAMMFHTSAIICVFFYFLNFDFFIKNKKKWRFFCFALGILSIFAIQLIKHVIVRIGFYGEYINRAVSFEFSELKCFAYIVPELLLIAYMERKAEKDKWITTLVNIFYFQIPFQFTQVYFDALIARAGFYCVIYRVILVPYLLQKIKNKKEKQFCIFMCGIWYFIYFIIMFFVLNGLMMFPYKFYWNN